MHNAATRVPSHTRPLHHAKFIFIRSFGSSDIILKVNSIHLIIRRRSVFKGLVRLESRCNANGTTYPDTEKPGGQMSSRVSLQIESISIA